MCRPHAGGGPTIQFEAIPRAGVEDRRRPGYEQPPTVPGDVSNDGSIAQEGTENTIAEFR